MEKAPLPWTAFKRLGRQHTGEPLQIHRACPACGADDVANEILSSLSDFQFFTDQQGLNRADHTVVVCASCGLLYTNPCYTPAGFQQLFEKAGLSYGHTAGRIVEQVDWLTQQFPEATSLLDVGCGNGDLIKALPATLQRCGMDVDQHTLDAAKKDAPDIDFSVCDFEGLLSLPQSDVITLFHVLEHLAKPGQFLKQLRQLAKPKAALVVEVPIVDRAAVEQDRDIVGFFTIQHLTHFSQASLAQMMLKNGWRVTQADAMSGYNGWRVVAEQCELSEQAFEKDDTALVAARTYLNVWQDNVAKVNQRIDAIKPASQIMVWGAGQHTEYLALLTRLLDSAAEFILLDSDPLKQGQSYHGIPVLAPEQVLASDWLNADFPIVISTYGGQQSVAAILASKGVDPARVITLYDRTQRY